MWIDDEEWVTTSEACQRLAPDVHPETLRNWYAPRNGRPATVRALRKPAAPGSGPGRGHEYVVNWPDVVEAERAGRVTARGRPRTAMRPNACGT